MKYTGYAVLEEGDFLSLVCSPECGEAMIEVMGTEYAARILPVAFDCAVCGESGETVEVVETSSPE